MEVIFDIETDNLEGNRIWVVVCQPVGTNLQFVFRNPTEGQTFRRFAARVTKWIGQNVIDFDLRVLANHFPELNLNPTDRNCYDTLVVSRLLRWKLDGGHSLDDWGRRLGLSKGSYNDWSHLNEEMVRYCCKDVRLTARLYNFQQRFRQSVQWQKAIKTEHQAAILCRIMTDTGFGFDVERACRLREELSLLLADIDAQIHRDIKPRVELVKEIHPKVTKNGTLSLTDFRWLGPNPDLRAFNGGPFCRVDVVPFNPASVRHRLDYLNNVGWKPVNKTKGYLDYLKSRPRKDDPKRAYWEQYGWKVDEDNLDTLPDDAPVGARLLAQRLSVSARLSDLDEYLGLVKDDGRIHGQFLHIGSWTGRMAHQRPNTGNISKVFEDKPGPLTPVEEIKKRYDGQIRSLWCVPEDHWQIGVDMDSAHLRVLAHLMDDKQFTASLVSGRKEDGTDPHTLNKKALGDACANRGVAKTFIYSWLNGAGTAKVASILRCDAGTAKRSLERFTSSYPGLHRLLTEDIPRDAARGYFQGIDGRLVIKDEEHGMLSGYLQSAEAILLKNFVWRAYWDVIKYAPIKLMDMVHDEVQIELCEDDRNAAVEIGRYFADTLTKVAEEYSLRCPFTGGVSVGHDWSGAH